MDLTVAGVAMAPFARHPSFGHAGSLPWAISINTRTASLACACASQVTETSMYPFSIALTALVRRSHEAIHMCLGLPVGYHLSTFSNAACTASIAQSLARRRQFASG